MAMEVAAGSVVRRAWLVSVVLSIVFATVPLIGPSSSARADAPDVYEKARTVARTEIWKDINSGKACSASVAIMDNGVIVYSEGFGMADREKSIPVARNTLFNIGSVSKVFTAVAIMALVDDGKVKLDEPVTRYLPEFVMADSRYKEITVRMLLNHTSGIPGTTAANNFGFAYNPDFFKQTLTNLATAHLKHPPGAPGPYCNDGFTLAEMIVERVSGRKFLVFLSDRVFKPLGMKDSGAGIGERPGEMAASFYQPDTGRREPLQVLSLIGCGGLGSTTEDLCRFEDSFSGKGVQILSASALAEMKKNQSPADPLKLRHPFCFGLGWDLTDHPAYKARGVQVLGKSGGTQRYSSMMYTLPDHRLSVAVIEAGQAGNAISTATKVLDALLVQKGLAENATPPVTRPPSRQPIPAGYAAFDGYYATPSPLRVSFDFEKNVVTLKTPHDEKAPVVSLYYHDGSFYDDSGNPSYFASLDGQDYYVNYFPVFKMDMVQAQKLKKLSQPKSLAINMNRRQWLMRSSKPFEAVSMAIVHVGRSRILPDLPGYVDFGGMMLILSPESAGMAVSRIRDLYELELIKKGGSTWARLSECLFSPAEEAPRFNGGSRAVTIGSAGYSEWVKTGADMVLRFRKPARGRVIVFTAEGSPIYDSITHEGALYAPGGTLIEFSGYAGDSFEIKGQ